MLNKGIGKPLHFRNYGSGRHMDGRAQDGCRIHLEKSPCILPRRRNQKCISRELNRAARYFMLRRSVRITLNDIIT